ncbi:MAG TPA: hypothetical protein VKU80_09830, partial [Planctomycetota bacterium]|nr:hypothetical protein [Planctomycetota bacterium]
HLMPILAGWRGDTGVSGLLQRFEEESPKVIVVGPGKLWWRDGQDPRTLLDIFPDMKNLLAERYRRVETISGFELWQMIK